MAGAATNGRVAASFRSTTDSPTGRPGTGSSPDTSPVRSQRSTRSVAYTDSTPLLAYPEEGVLNAFPSIESPNTATFSASYSAYSRELLVRCRYYIPITGWLPVYDLKLLGGDAVAGLTVSFLIIPQALSYAQALVRVPPIFGLYTAIISTFLYALLGTSRQMAIGPDALVALMSGSIVREFTQWRDHASLAGSDVAEVFRTIENGPVLPIRTSLDNVQPTALLCLMIGLFTFCLGFFRLGFVDSVLSRALLRGFILAVACVVMIEMSDAFLGLTKAAGDEVVDVALSPFLHLCDTMSSLGAGQAHLLTSLVSGASVAFLVGMKSVKQRYAHLKPVVLLPEILLLVVISTLLTYIFRWDLQGLAILARVDTDTHGQSTMPIPTLAKIKHLMLSAVLISMIGLVESIAVAKTYASKHDYVVSPNRELVAMGVCNTIASLFGCFPSFGSLGRSSVNDTAGACTQLAGFFTSFFVLCTTLFLMPAFEYLPRCVCSSIILVAAFKLVELEDVYFIIRLRAWDDFGLLLLTFLSTIFIGVETGTLVSVGTSLLLVVKHTTRTRLALLGASTVLDPVSGEQKRKFRPVTEDDVQRFEGVVIIRIEETMFFGNVGQLKDRLRRIEVHGDLGVHPSSEPSGPQTRAIIFEMASVGALDASATQTLLEIVEAYTNRGIAIRFVKVREACKVLFDRAGIRLGLCHRKIADALEDLGFYALTASTYPAHQPIPSPSPTSPYSTAVHALHKSP